jgi:hypothetical protein
MNIGEAISALKHGRWVRRAGWNGKGMHLYMEEWANVRMPRLDAKRRKIVYEDIGRRHEPFIVLFTTAGTHQPGWNASTPDLLADDWEEVPVDEMK